MCGPRTHAELKALFEALGSWLARNAVLTQRRSGQVPDLTWARTVIGTLEPLRPDHDSAKLRRLFDSVMQAARGAASPNFAATYRDVEPAQDEHLSTSSIASLVQGVARQLVADGADPLLVDAFATMFNAISLVRMATRWTGFNFAMDAERMQHPTGPLGGMWGTIARGDGSARAHSQRDLERRNFVYSTMESARIAGSTASEVLREGLLAALRASMNTMVAPAAASDQLPLQLEYPGEELAQTRARELLKSLANQLGVEQERGDPRGSMNRPWGERPLADPLSPGRVDDPPAVEADGVDDSMEWESVGEPFGPSTLRPAAASSSASRIDRNLVESGADDPTRWEWGEETSWAEGNEEPLPSGSLFEDEVEALYDSDPEFRWISPSAQPSEVVAPSVNPQASIADEAPAPLYLEGWQLQQEPDDFEFVSDAILGFDEGDLAAEAPFEAADDDDIDALWSAFPDVTHLPPPRRVPLEAEEMSDADELVLAAL